MSADPFKRVRAVARRLPGVVESTSYGTPALKIGGALVARLHQDGEALVVRSDPFEREVLLAANPAVYFITAHYENHPWVLVRLAKVKPAELRLVLEAAARLAQPSRATKPRAGRARRAGAGARKVR